MEFRCYCECGIACALKDQAILTNETTRALILFEWWRLSRGKFRRMADNTADAVKIDLPRMHMRNLWWCTRIKNDCVQNWFKWCTDMRITVIRANTLDFFHRICQQWQRTFVARICLSQSKCLLVEFFCLAAFRGGFFESIFVKFVGANIEIQRNNHVDECEYRFHTLRVHSLTCSTDYEF